MNVILLIFDSLRRDCIGILGNPPWGKVKTPNLDRFAGESFILGRCYPESLPTLPARRAIYTGMRVYPFNKDIYLKGDIKGSPGWGPIDEDRSTLSEILQQNGYTTCLISDIQHMFKPSKNFHRGFSQWQWIRGYEVDAYKSGPLPDRSEIDKYLPKEIQNEIRINFLSQCLMNIQEVKQEEDYSVAKVMRQSVKWLEQNRDKDKLFLTIEAWSPHEPWFVPSYYREMYSTGYPQQVLSLYCDTSNISENIIKGTQANYSGMVTMCDRWFGYLYEALYNMSMLDNTLIVITSDHGHSIGENNFLGKKGYPSYPEVFDTFIFLRHPDSSYGRGKKSNILIQHTDIPATILDIIGVEPKISDERFKWADYFKGLLGKQMFNQKSRVEKINMHGRSFFNHLVNDEPKFRENVTIGWGAAVTVITNKWWFNCRVDGKGAFLYDLEEGTLSQNIADNNPDLVRELFNIALEDAGGSFPDYLVDMAKRQEDVPGCSVLAAF